MDGDASFGHWLTRRRKALALSRVELARRVGCATVTLRKIEADERRPSRQIAERLAEHLAAVPQERATFVKAARGELGVDRLLSADTPPLAAYPLRATRLPVPPTPLVGRARQLAVLRDRLASLRVRLVTLTGPPGVGKTRLAIQVAAELLDNFADGVWFVDLAALTDPIQVVPTIAQRLGVRESGGQSLFERLRDYLQNKQLLLLLDNFEQVLTAARQVSDLLAVAPQLSVLVTSRVALHIYSEHEFTVPPLALPDLAHLPPLRDLALCPAIELLVARVQTVKPDFALTEANAPDVAAICARLDGLPLAIELAAARVKLLPPQALLARLDQRLSLLTNGACDLPTRQQTLRNTLNWSYGLLDPAAQALFARLGVFVGGWTLDAAETVCSTADGLPSDIFDDIAALVDHSLVRQTEGLMGEPRFIMLETIRAYALEQLEASYDAEQLRQRHARYYLALSAEGRPSRGSDDGTWVRRSDSEYDNLWAALAWSQTTAGDSEIALQLVGVLVELWYHRGIRREAIVALERTLHHPLGLGRTTAHADARAGLAQLLAVTGNYSAARMQYEQALSLARELGDAEQCADILERLGWLAREQGDSATAWSRLSESLAIYCELDNSLLAAGVLNTLAGVAILDEDPAQAEALLTESRRMAQRAAPDSFIIAWTLNHLGHVAQLRGAYDRAVQLHQESLVVFQASLDHSEALPQAYHDLGQALLALGRLDEAGHWMAQGLAAGRTLNNQACITWCLAGLGSVAALRGQPEQAARLWGAAEELRLAIGCRYAPAARTTYERALAAASTQLSDVAFVAAWGAGRMLRLDPAIAEALEPEAVAAVPVSAPRAASPPIVL